MLSVDEMQFGFVSGRGTTDANFILRNFKRSFFSFIDLKRAIDRIPCDILCWAVRTSEDISTAILKFQMHALKCATFHMVFDCYSQEYKQRQRLVSYNFYSNHSSIVSRLTIPDGFASQTRF